MDLKTTLLKAKIKPTEIALHFGESKQMVNYWVNVNVPKAWVLVLKQYFNARGIEVFEKEGVKIS